MFQEYIRTVTANRDEIQYELRNNGYTFIASDSNFINVEGLQLSDGFLYKYFEYNGRKMFRFSIPTKTTNYLLLMKTIRERK